MRNDRSKIAFIVKGPPTYMNAEEAWYKFSDKKEDAILFVVLGKGNWYKMKERMQEVIDVHKWEKIIWIETLSNVKVGTKLRIEKPDKRFILQYYKYQLINIYRLIIDRIRLTKAAKEFQPCKIVFTCRDNLREHLAAELNPERVYLIDSGMNILKSVAKNGYIDYRQKKNKLSRLINKIIGYKIFDRKRTYLFTAYSDSLNTKHKIEPLTHDYKKSVIFKKNKGDFAVWINTPFCDQFGVSIDAYIDYMKATINRLDIDGRKMVYIPHPGRESAKNLEYIKSTFECQIDGRLLPVEMKIVNYKNLPSLCVSPTSSSLNNLSYIFENKIKLYSAWHYEFGCFKSYTLWRNSAVSDSNTHIEFININNCKSLFNISTKGDKRQEFETLREWVAMNNDGVRQLIQ